MDAHSNRIVLLLFMIHRGYAYHEIVGSVGYSLAWLVAHAYHFFPFCSCSNVGEEKGLFADGQVEWYNTVKLKSRWFHYLLYLNLMYYNHIASSASGTSLRTAFQHRPGKLIFHFPTLCSLLLLCITPTLISIHFESAYLKCHVNTIDAHPMRIQFDSLQMCIESASHQASCESALRKVFGHSY